MCPDISMPCLITCLSIHQLPVEVICAIESWPFANLHVHQWHFFSVISIENMQEFNLKRPSWCNIQMGVQH